MAEPITPTPQAAPSAIQTGQLRVTCSGPAHGKHPKVFLTMNDDAQGQPSHVVCPYCSQTFHHNPHLANPNAHH